MKLEVRSPPPYQNNANGAAPAFIIPQILLNTVTAPKGTPVPFTHYFDLEHFTSTLQACCPQIHLYASQNELFDIPSTAKAIPLNPTSITTSLIDGYILGSPGDWYANFRAFMKIQRPVAPTAEKPVLVNLGSPLMQFPLSYDSPHFVAHFGRILRFRPDVRQLAATVLFALSQKHALALDPTNPGFQSNTFLGAHLRTSADAVAAGWTPYAIQEGNYLSSATSTNTTTIFLSTLDAASIDTFTRRAADSNIAVETMNSLLSIPGVEGATAAKGFTDEWAALQGLSWDQQLLIDYSVLLHASLFAGTWESSFSWAVAMRRHVVISGTEGWVDISGQSVLSSSSRLSPPSTSPYSNSSRIEGRDDPPTLPEDLPSNTALEAAAASMVAASAAASQVAKLAADLEVAKTQKDETKIIQLTQQEEALQLKLEEQMNRAGRPASESEAERKKTWANGKGGVVGGAKVQEMNKKGISWSDEGSIVYGPAGEGRRVMGSLWP